MKSIKENFICEGEEKEKRYEINRENLPKGGLNYDTQKEYILEENLNKTIRIRNHSKCQSAETLFKGLVENSYSFILNNTKYTIIHSTIKKGRNRKNENKNDCMFEIRNDIGDTFLIGVQIKYIEKENQRIIVHNWRYKKQKKDVENYEDISLEEKDIIEKDFKNGCKEILSQKEIWKNRRKKQSGELLKFGMQVSDKPIFEDSEEIRSLLLKKHFIKNLYNPVDYFYHLKISNRDSSNEHITFQDLIDRMVFIDDKEIEKIKLYWHPRPIYSSSGKTQLGQEDFLKLFYKSDFSSFLDEINNITE